MNRSLKETADNTTVAPVSEAELADAIRSTAESKTPVYPRGGGTSLNFGLPAASPGVVLSLENLRRVIDYPARDMTVTVEAGITMAELARVLAAEKQQLPIDVPLVVKATLGGVIATNWSGPRRYGYGTIRDYVIGIRAVDGRGRPFQGGGRVVKNVAGYDFCKLLVGSLGTLGVITQVTLKVKPLAEATSLLSWNLPDWDTADRALASLVRSATTPAAIELLAGSDWPSAAPGVANLVVIVEGDSIEVSWMVEALDRELAEFGLRRDLDRTPPPMASLVEFSATDGSPLVVKASVRPSQVVSFAQLAFQIDPKASVQAHAGSGVVLVRFSELKPQTLTRDVVGRLQPAARAAGGSAIIVSATGAELTRQSVWGHLDDALDVMREVKKAFDPANILNRGRFVFS